MQNFKKLSRAEMKNVKGGVSEPSCTNDCGGTSGTCPSGQTCKFSVACPDDPKFEHNVCVSS